MVQKIPGIGKPKPSSLDHEGFDSVSSAAPMEALQAFMVRGLHGRALLDEVLARIYLPHVKSLEEEMDDDDAHYVVAAHLCMMAQMSSMRPTKASAPHP